LLTLKHPYDRAQHGARVGKQVLRIGVTRSSQPEKDGDIKQEGFESEGVGQEHGVYITTLHTHSHHKIVDKKYCAWRTLNREVEWISIVRVV
jgi:hypothetical protein